MKTKVLIINFNRLDLPRRMADWVAERGCDPVFIDNNSSYPPLLDYYKNCPYQVMRMKFNQGHTVVWYNRDILKELRINERFIMTDPDLDLSGVPDDFLKILNEGLDLLPDYDKCALSLEIEDLPDTPEGNFIKVHERKYWNFSTTDNRFLLADTDTTFALYRWPLGAYGHSAIRTNRPYTARHVPWYYKNLREIPADEQYYFQTASGSSSGKERLIKL